MSRRKSRPKPAQQPERVLTASDMTFIGAAKVFEQCGPRMNAAANLTPAKRKAIAEMTALLDANTDDDFAVAALVCLYRLGVRVHQKESGCV